MELPMPYLIRESSHLIHNPIGVEKIATLGAALRPAPGTTMLDLACGSGYLLSEWADVYGVTGVGVDISARFLAGAAEYAAARGVADLVSFVHADAAGHVAETPVDIAACIGATWIGGGVAGTVELLRRSVKPGGLLLVGEPFWRRRPEDEQTARACHVMHSDEFGTLPELLERFRDTGCDVVEMVLGDQDDWDRYEAAQWLNTRRWCDANPEHELHDQMRAEVEAAPVRYAAGAREYLGWGIFVLMVR